MEREGAEPATKRARPAYVRYFFSDGVGFILSLPPDIRRLVTSKRYWTPFDCLMVAMAHFDWDPAKSLLPKLVEAQERAAQEGTYGQFAYFCEHVPLEHWKCRLLTWKVAEGGDVEKMKLLEELNMGMAKKFKFDLENVAAFHGKPEMMRYLHYLTWSETSSNPRYNYFTLGQAAAGGHLNAFKECLTNFDSLDDDSSWYVYKQLIKRGQLHIIQWLEREGQLKEPGGDSWDPDYNWRFFNEDHLPGKAEVVAAKYGQIHILNWALKTRRNVLSFFTLINSVMKRPNFAVVDWAFDNLRPREKELRSMGMASLIFRALGELEPALARHMFKRGVSLDTSELREWISRNRGKAMLERTVVQVEMLLKSVENAENEPNKYIVEMVNGRRYVHMRYPSYSRYQGE